VRWKISQTRPDAEFARYGVFEGPLSLIPQYGPARPWGDRVRALAAGADQV